MKICTSKLGTLLYVANSQTSAVQYLATQPGLFCSAWRQRLSFVVVVVVVVVDFVCFVFAFGTHV